LCLYKNCFFACIKMCDTDFAIAFFYTFFTHIGLCILVSLSGPLPLPRNLANARTIVCTGLYCLSMLKASTTWAEAKYDYGPPMLLFVHMGL
jgi:hypothetical protein